MGLSYLDSIRHSWTLFKPGVKGKSVSTIDKRYSGQKVKEVQGLDPKKQVPLKFTNVSSFAATIFTRIAIDCAQVEFQHVKIDSETETQHVQTKSSLHRIFNVEANQDQTSVDFFHELVYNLFDDGEVVVVPTVTDVDPGDLSYNVQELRIGKTIERYRDSIKVRLYNPEIGDFSDVVVKKKFTAIIQNPLYAVLANGNPTLERLLRKLSIVDKEDLAAITNKLNIIVELPTPVKGEIKRKEAEARVKDIEKQLRTNSLGIAYIGTNEKITQLGRQITSTIMDDIKYLTEELMHQLGLNERIFDGTASASETQNYYVRTIEPIVRHIQQEFQRKFLTKTAYTQGQRITTYMDPFKLVDISSLASTGDSLIRNGIMSANEFRQKIGLGPHWAPQADMLFNPNIANKNQAGGYGYAEDPAMGMDPSMMDPSMMGEDPSMMDPSMMGEDPYQNEGEFDEEEMMY